MIEHTITGLMLVVAAIHLVPIAGFFGRERLTALYGIPIDNPDLEILMRHRAVLFGILGLFFAYAAFTPALQSVAFVAAAISISSFFYLARSSSATSLPPPRSPQPSRSRGHASL